LEARSLILKPVFVKLAGLIMAPSDRKIASRASADGPPWAQFRLPKICWNPGRMDCL